MSDFKEVNISASIDFTVSLDGTRSVREVIEEFELEFNQPQGCHVVLVNNEFTVTGQDDIDD